jgi:hypothetical protein
MYISKNNAIRKTKKHYTSILKTANANSYKLHEKMTTSLNQSNVSETTTSKTYMTKIFSPSIHKTPINENSTYHIKKCSYVDFLELRRTKNSLPFGYKEKRFKWQNLKDESNIVDPLIYKKFQKKRVHPPENFGEGILNFVYNRKEPQPKPKGKRLKRLNSEKVLGIKDLKDFQKYSEFYYSRRVLQPKLNDEIPKISKKKSFSQSKYMFHRTDGSLKSLFESTPLEVPLMGNKKLYKNKSYGALTINLFDKNYGQYQMPTHTKKLFLDNVCQVDNISNENLITDVNECWRQKRKNKYKDLRLMTSTEFDRNRDIKRLKLRNYYLNNIENNKGYNSISKIKRKEKINH